MIGFFNSDQLHGYGRVVDVKNALEGLFENGIYRKEKYQVTRYGQSDWIA